jgi:integrase/recombinase XerD
VSTLAEHAGQYLKLRRAVGFKLVGEAQLLAEFVGFAEAAGERTVRTEAALGWARLPAGASQNYLSRRLRVVRSFARYLHALDPACEVPSIELLRASKYRPAPFLYSEPEIVALMTAARGLHPPLRAATMETVIGLLACTGLRIGEALHLDREDVDADQRLLIVHDSKFGKSREMLLHPSTVRALVSYREIRDRLCPHPTTRSFFITTRETRPAHPTIHQPFRQLLDQTGVHWRSPTGRARIHDIRH